MLKRLGWTVCACALVAAAGCSTCGSFSASCPCRPPAPRPGAAVIIPAPPQPVPVVPPAAVQPGVVVPAPTPPPADVRNYAPFDPTWRPSPGAGVQLGCPEQPPETARLTPQPQTPAPPRNDDRAGTPPLPVGIPQFALAKTKVAAGLKPMLDGLDWLQANGYKTALYIRRPGEDDSADRRQFEDRRGIKYVSLVVSPETLTNEVVDQFNHIVNDPGSQPLFVYDKDGVLAGALWYLHFRLSAGLPDAEARAAAAKLGLKEDADGEARDMWLAAQRVLSRRK